MARVIDLKNKAEEPHKKEEPILHPIVREQQLITDSGEKLPYQTLRWIAPSNYKREGDKVSYYFVGFLALLTIVVIFFQKDWI